MDLDKIKNIVIQHFEKAVFAGIAAVALLMIVSGVNKPNFLEKHQPDELSSSANQVKRSIDEDHNDVVIGDRRPTDSIFDATVELYKPVDSSLYSLSNPWVVRESESVIRRRDPNLVAIGSLRVEPVVCTLAYNGAGAIDGYPLAEQPDAAVFPVEEEPAARLRRGRRGRDRSEEEFEDFAADAEPEEEIPEVRIFDSSLGRGFQDLRAESEFNFPQPKAGRFIAGTALLPHREIYLDYLAAYEESEGFVIDRDTPFYYDLEVQRAEVTNKSVEELTPEDWNTVWTKANYIELAARIWNHFAPEFVPADYRDEFITMWIPPILVEDYHDFTTHPSIPRLSVAELKEIEARRLEEESKVVGPLTLGQKNVADPSASNQRDLETDSGAGQDDRLERDPVQYKLIRFFDFADIAPPSSKVGTPRPGAVYVYRVRYAVVDPNFPIEPQEQPRLNSLDAEVARRVQPKIDLALRTGTRDFWLWSEWSEPSPPVSLGSVYRNYVGPVQPGGQIYEYPVAGRPVTVRKEPTSIEVALTEMNAEVGATLQATVTVQEGTALSYRGDRVEAIDPISGKIKQIPNYQLDTGGAVIDIDGGMPLANGDELSEPTTVLMIDRNGKLIVGDSIRQELPYRVNSYAAERGIE